MQKMNKKIFLRLVKEFWFPTLAALIWVSCKAPWANFHWTDMADVVANFGSSFFLTSFFVSQYFRVQKINRDTETFGVIQRRLEHLIDELDIKTARLSNSLMGGGSYLIFNFSQVEFGSDTGKPTITHCGEYALFDIIFSVIDLEMLKQRCIEGDNFSVATERSRFVLKSETLIPNTSQSFGNKSIGAGQDYRSYVIEVFARNGVTFQQLRVAKQNGRWTSASRVFRSGQVIEQRIEENFPLMLLEGDELWNESSVRPQKFQTDLQLLRDNH